MSEQHYIPGPFLVGDRVKIKGTKKYGEVAHRGASILVRLKNGKMEAVSKALLEFNYGRS